MSSREPIFLEPVFQEKIWGGDRLRTSFGYDIPSGHTGECWAISGHPGGDCRIKGRPGQTLGGLWREERALFGGLAGEGFPLLVKLLDAREDLSIQVHPDDSYAHLHENGASGKTECWYILDCDPDATIIIGHHARSPRELREMGSGGGSSSGRSPSARGTSSRLTRAASTPSAGAPSCWRPSRAAT